MTHPHVGRNVVRFVGVSGSHVRAPVRKVPVERTAHIARIGGNNW